MSNQTYIELTLMGNRHEHHGPTIAVIECPNFQLLKSSIQVLDDFPCVNVPANARDSQYQVNSADSISG